MEVYITYEGTRDDEEFIKTHGKHKAFHKGGNSSYRLHIHQHYKLYKERCEKEKIPINHWAIPHPIWKEMEEEKETAVRSQLTKTQQQQQLSFQTVIGPHEFTRASTLHAVMSLSQLMIK